MKSFWLDGRRAAVSLTFDDARPSQLVNGLPLLTQSGLRATFYVSLANLEPEAERWREAAAGGHEIGNHTLTHPCSGNFSFARENPLEEYTLDRMEAELIGADAEIERLLGVRPQTFGYPCGQTFVGRGVETRSYAPIVARRFLAGRGYMNGWANDPERCDLTHLVSGSMDQTSVEDIVQQLEQEAEEGGWIILTGHDVGLTENTGLNVSREKLVLLLAYLEHHSDVFWVDTVASIATHLRDHRGEA
jgi:peptidoglycan/xylan/chitin deacetylase (PgdA/CDA1 family)